MNRNAKVSWEEAQTFLAVAEGGSFSAAGKVLGLGQPTISRRIQSLETNLEQQLFVRGKHGAIATEAALRLLPAAEQMARWASEFDHAVHGLEESASGVVRIAAPPGIAAEQLAPFAKQLSETEPNLRLEILSSVEHIDLTRGGADIAVRTQYPNEPELVALYSGKSEPGVYASRTYLEKIEKTRGAKRPLSWDDLDWVCWSESRRHVTPWPILNRLVKDFTPVFASDDYLVQKAAVRNGIGAMVMGRPLSQSDLVEIDMGVKLPHYDFHIVVAKSMQQVPRIRVVVEQMVRTLLD